SDLPDEFAAGPADAGTGGAPVVRIVVLAFTRRELPSVRDPEWYGDTVFEWRPYGEHVERPGPGALATAAWRAAQFAEQLGYSVRVSGLSSDSGEHFEGDVAAPTIVLIDPWTALSGRYRDRLSEIGQAA